jgi:nucleoid DNA-binding protein
LSLNFVEKPRQHYGVSYVFRLVQTQNLPDQNVALILPEYLLLFYLYRMSSLITDTIREILMEEQHVCLPGIGTLRLSPQVAMISPIEGKATPPSERVIFNSNLVLDDGRVLSSLEDIPILSKDEAKMLLGEFLANITENLDAGRSVTLEGIGRLFKHFDGQLRFTAGGENFSKDSFGLPDIDLKPIARTEKARPVAVPIGADPMLATTSPAAAAEKPAKRRSPAATGKWGEFLSHPDLNRYLWYFAAILATLAILTLGYLLVQTIAKSYADDKPITPITRVERQPVVVEEPAVRTPLPPVDADRVIPEEPPRLRDTPAAEKPKPFEQPASEPATAPPQASTPAAINPATTPDNNRPYNIALIATGMYGSKANVTKNKARINKLGFEAFDRQDGRYTRVGVRLQYTSKTDLMETLQALQKTYNDAFVMEINGKKVRID